ncbi:MAG: hypothetical protein KAS23_07535, partial [Anaerohalosphaera sp.]|nr:hypothetical protein [Anaerohalosphaera sp.]
LINLGLGIEAIQLSIFIALTVGIVMLSFPLAGLMCRKKFGPVRFSIWTAFWLVIATIVSFIVIAIIQSVSYEIPISEMLSELLIAGFIFAGVLIAGLLPFEIILFANSFWRKRFEAVFGLKTDPVPIERVQMDDQPETYAE